MLSSEFPFRRCCNHLSDGWRSILFCETAVKASTVFRGVLIDFEAIRDRIPNGRLFLEGSGSEAPNPWTGDVFTGSITGRSSRREALKLAKVEIENCEVSHGSNKWVQVPKST